MPSTVPKVVTSMRGAPEIVKQSIYDISLTQNHPLGTRLEIGDGRVFYYARAGATNLDPSKMCDSAVPVANHRNIAVAAAASVGQGRVRVTLGATAATANQYAEGYLNVVSGGGGQANYKIKSHLAIAASGSGWIELYDPIQVALTTSMTVTLRKNPWDGVVVSPTTVASTPCGVPPVTVTASYYFWCQTWGPASCLIGAGPPTIGTALMRSGATAGALILATAGNPIVGWLMSAEAAAAYGLVFLTIAP